MTVSYECLIKIGDLRITANILIHVAIGN